MPEIKEMSEIDEEVEIEYMKKNWENIMKEDKNKFNNTSCINCKKNEIEMGYDPYCKVCWSLTEGYLLQIPPLKVLSVISEGEKAYKEIMAHPSLKPFHDISSTSVAIPLRSLIRRNMVYMSNRISGTYSITDLGIMALDNMETGKEDIHQ